MSRKFSWINPKVEVRNSGINGRGLFAKDKINKGEVVTVSGGIIVDDEEYKKLKNKKKEFFMTYSTPVADGFYIISGFSHKKLEPDDFYNHGCSPNCVLGGHLVITALRDIEKDEELTLDYGTFEDDENYKLICNCGSPECRKIITGKDWMKPELQKKYNGYFIWHLQQKINSMNNGHEKE